MQVEEELKARLMAEMEAEVKKLLEEAEVTFLANTFQIGQDGLDLAFYNDTPSIAHVGPVVVN